MEKIIQIEKLSKTFDQVKALSNIDLEIKKGEIFGLIGPDGAGKTTMMRILSGIMVPGSGIVRVLNYSLPAQAEKVKQQTGYMSQKFNLYYDLSVQENIEFFADIFQVKIHNLSRILEPLYHMTRLYPFKNRLAGQLSGGMKQKLALMCTLIHKPRILFLDEPTTGVDPVSRREFWQILQEILQENITIMISTPYMDEAEWCSKIGLLYNGQMLSCNTPGYLKKNSGLVCLDVLFKHRNNNNDKFINGLPGLLDYRVLGNKYHLIFPESQKISGIKKNLSQQAVIQETSPLIEDIFILNIQKQRPIK